MPDIIQVANLSKRFGSIHAVDDLSFSVPKGVVYGFLGQNGAGKSTTIRILLTLIAADAGSVSMFGKDHRKHRLEVLSRIGALIEKPDLYTYLTAYENLRMMSQLSRVHATKDELMVQLEKVGLGQRAHSKVKGFSQGMKQRLGIACALIHNPELLILDEPTNGLDPQGIADIRNLILQLSRDEGRTVVLSSHLLHEIELIADDMLIVDKGRKVAEGKVSALLNPSDTLVELSTQDDTSARSLLAGSGWQKYLLDDETLVLKMDSKDVPELVQWLVEKGVKIMGVDARHSLEAYFLSQTQSVPHVEAYGH